MRIGQWGDSVESSEKTLCPRRSGFPNGDSRQARGRVKGQSLTRSLAEFPPHFSLPAESSSWLRPQKVRYGVQMIQGQTDNQARGTPLASLAVGRGVDVLSVQLGYVPHWARAWAPSVKQDGPGRKCGLRSMSPTC